MSAAAVFNEEEAVPSLVSLLLEEQQRLSAVERFSEKHDADTLPLQTRYYEALMPASEPGPGQQFAFRVDLDACTGCKACVTACHSSNGLDLEETWRDVGTLVADSGATPILQSVTTACHHCEDPACMSGCPVAAYEKDPVTGIVRHLDDQCIGCQYCVLMCPYDVPKYSEARGIVRKCDMCSDRLAENEAPACVQGCPNGAISIEIVDQGVARPDFLLPVVSGGMPSSATTRPTTRYVGKRQSPAALLRPADWERVEAASAHTPLAVMLVAVQLSVGVLLFDRIFGLLAPESSASLRPAWALLAAAFGLAGQAAAVLHLGRPQYAFRAFLGWRTSWMSREILILGLFAAWVAAYAASFWLGTLFTGSQLPQILLEPALSLAALLLRLQSRLAAGAVALGLLGSFCSVMIYTDTRREFWSLGRCSGRFFGSILALGPPALLVVGLWVAQFQKVPELAGLVIALCGLTLLGTAGKITGEICGLRHLREPEPSALSRSASLIVGTLGSYWRARLVAAGIGGLLLPWLVLELGSGPLAVAVATLMLGLIYAGEQLERHLFFRAEASRAMPRAA